MCNTLLQFDCSGGVMVPLERVYLHGFAHYPDSSPGRQHLECVGPDGIERLVDRDGLQSSVAEYMFLHGRNPLSFEGPLCRVL